MTAATLAKLLGREGTVTPSGDDALSGWRIPVLIKDARENFGRLALQVSPIKTDGDDAWVSADRVFINDDSVSALIFQGAI